MSNRRTIRNRAAALAEAREEAPPEVSYELRGGRKVPMRPWDGCPMFPVDYLDPRTGKRPYALIRADKDPAYIRIKKSIDGADVACPMRFQPLTISPEIVGKRWGNGTYLAALVSSAETNSEEMFKRVLVIEDNEDGLPFPGEDWTKEAEGLNWQGRGPDNDDGEEEEDDPRYDPRYHERAANDPRGQPRRGDYPPRESDAPPSWMRWMTPPQQPPAPPPSVLPQVLGTLAPLGTALLQGLLENARADRLAAREAAEREEKRREERREEDRRREEQRAEERRREEKEEQRRYDERRAEEARREEARAAQQQQTMMLLMNRGETNAKNIVAAAGEMLGTRGQSATDAKLDTVMRELESMRRTRVAGGGDATSILSTMALIEKIRGNVRSAPAAEERSGGIEWDAILGTILEKAGPDLLTGILSKVLGTGAPPGGAAQLPQAEEPTSDGDVVAAPENYPGAATLS